MAWTREQMCERASKELENGFYENGFKLWFNEEIIY